MSPPSPPPLMDELVEEIVLRIRPDSTGALVRAALVCKSWFRLISSERFLRRYREFHRASPPPMLGFILDLWDIDAKECVSRFVRTSPSSCPPVADGRGWLALDARHGRVLLYRAIPPLVEVPFFYDYDLLVWNPITDECRRLPMLRWYWRCPAWTAAVVSADATRDHHYHLDDDPHFLVVLVGIIEGYVFVNVYSSETGAWGGLTPYIDHLGPVVFETSVVRMGRGVLVGGALHFPVDYCRKIISYDIANRSMSIKTTPQDHCVGNIVPAVVATKDDGGGVLGVAGVEGYYLYLWSWCLSPDDEDGRAWDLERVIELDQMLSMDLGVPTTLFRVVGFAEGAGTVLVSASDGIYTVAVESAEIKKVQRRTHFLGIVPYVNFYTPSINNFE